MKTNIIKYIIFSLLVIITFSCSNTEDNLFDESASLRIEKNREKFQKILENSEEGWLFQYFPHPEQIFGGINYYLKFENGNVTAEIDGIDEKVSSMYSIINRGGNILSFNSYNSILHLYANPSGGIKPAPKGKEGDFEFLILNQEEDTINLKGLRSGNLMRLVKLKNTTKEYKDKVKDISDFVNSVFLQGYAEEKKINIEKVDNILTFTYKEGNESKIVRTAFISTDKGIRLYNSININGNEYKDFNLNKEDNNLYSLDNQVKLKVIPLPFDIKKEVWKLKIDKDNASPIIIDIFNKVKELNTIKWGEELDSNIIFGDTKELNIVGIKFKSLIEPFDLGLGYPVIRDLEFRGVEDHKNQLDILSSEGSGYNWNYYKHLQLFVNFITKNAPYILQKNDEDNPTEVKLQNKDNPDIWFILKK